MPPPQVTHEQNFSFMGEALCFQTNHPALLAAAHEAFYRFPPAAPTSQPLMLRLFVDPTQDEFSSGNYPKPVYHTAGHLCFVNVGAANTIVVDMQAGYAIGFVTPSVAQDAAFVRYTFIEAAAQAMLGLARNFVVIHAACVVKAGIGLLLCAPSGTGKSTLAYACLRRGYQILAEDVVQVNLSRPQPQFWGIPWKFHLQEDSLHFFPELAEPQVQMSVNGERKLELEIETRFPGAARTHIERAFLVFLARRPTVQAASLEQLSLSEARRAFSVIWSWESGWQAAYETRLLPLLTQGAYRLSINGTPDATVTLLDEWIERQQRGV